MDSRLRGASGRTPLPAAFRDRGRGPCAPGASASSTSSVSNSDSRAERVAAALLVLPRAGLAHVAQHLHQQHRLELRGDALQLLAIGCRRRAAPSRLAASAAPSARAFDDGRDVDAHRITISARSAPAALSACMMAMMSRGVDAERVERAHHVAQRRAGVERRPAARRLPRRRARVCGTTVVWPPDSGAGCETSYCVEMRTDRLPCATAAGPRRTSPPITTVPVRSLMTTRAVDVERDRQRLEARDQLGQRRPDTRAGTCTATDAGIDDAAPRRRRAPC